jgi:hypothetical protein
MPNDASQSKRPKLTVRELLAILADCDPDATVDLSLPGHITESDQIIVRDPDVGYFELSYMPDVSAGYMTSAENEAQILDENNRIRPGVKPNHVTIALLQEDADQLLKLRRLGIERDNNDALLDPEPIENGPETVVVDVRLPRELWSTIRHLLRDFNQSPQVKDEQACTHGLLTVAGTLAMLAEDVGMVWTRPGSWEGSNMAQVFSSHGYNR